MIYEKRVYKAVPGKLPAINARFANHTCAFFKEFDIGMVGFWNDEIGASNQMTYITSFDSMADREEKWTAFGAHKPWNEVRAETEVDGPLVAQVINSFMTLTDYSPQPSFKTSLQELRIYDAMPGKMPDLNNRFKNHTMALFEKHGIENVAYWTDVVGTSNRLTYMLGYPDLAGREKGWSGFQSDPAWQTARAASEENGALVRVSKHSMLRLADYSPR
ncbi:MAG TPA: NIPSNAP family protein [Dehalococcoidia bacterium]|nr:NIPSNAP family protein [Dehalococcoidia bacterium]